MGKLFYGTGDILINGRHVNFVIILPWADFSWGRTPAFIQQLSPYMLSDDCAIVGLY